VSETGAIKFSYEHVKRTLEPFAGFDQLNKCREELRHIGFIGVDQNGIGFGNLSVRHGLTKNFHITGSGTGGLKCLTLDDYAKVTAYDFEKNWLHCEGMTVASSESLTHAAIYAADANANAVIHIHSAKVWKRWVNKVPTTSPDVDYGTPAMAEEVKRLFVESDLPKRKLLVMGGHKTGIITFGATLDEAFRGAPTR
jgi:ribulose-5-phosphate 4-epimerase/fuculose-1-phosphate aldolase